MTSLKRGLNNPFPTAYRILCTSLNATTAKQKANYFRTCLYVSLPDLLSTYNPRGRHFRKKTATTFHLVFIHFYFYFTFQCEMLTVPICRYDLHRHATNKKVFERPPDIIREKNSDRGRGASGLLHNNRWFPTITATSRSYLQLGRLPAK
jgi:hypothetical protein